MASVSDLRPQPENDTGAWESRRPLSMNEMETSRQDRQALGFVLLFVAAIVVGMLALLALGGPRVEDPLPVPSTSTVVTPASTKGWAGNGNCPPECLRERGVIVPGQ